jgi:type IV secretion system protein VirD4
MKQAKEPETISIASYKPNQEMLQQIEVYEHQTEEVKEKDLKEQTATQETKALQEEQEMDSELW